jgi:hypothetical protein
MVLGARPHFHGQMMSATLRPEWSVTPMYTSWPEASARIEVDCRNMAAMEKALRALQAFDALLAVAKLAETACMVHPEYLGRDGEWPRLRLALDALDAAHPDWRDWK